MLKTPLCPKGGPLSSCGAPCSVLTHLHLWGSFLPLLLQSSCSYHTRPSRSSADAIYFINLFLKQRFKVNSASSELWQSFSCHLRSLSSLLFCSCYIFPATHQLICKFFRARNPPLWCSFCTSQYPIVTQETSHKEEEDWRKNEEATDLLTPTSSPLLWIHPAPVHSLSLVSWGLGWSEIAHPLFLDTHSLSFSCNIKNISSDTC